MSKKQSAKLCEDIRSLNLVPVHYLLVKNRRWGLKRISKSDTEYRLFLQAIRDTPESAMAPSRNVDEFWHTHILCTALYTEHCLKVYGRYLHHYAFSGVFGEEDEAVQRQRYINSQSRIAALK